MFPAKSSLRIVCLDAQEEIDRQTEAEERLAQLSLHCTKVGTNLAVDTKAVVCCNAVWCDSLFIAAPGKSSDNQLQSPMKTPSCNEEYFTNNRSNTIKIIALLEICEKRNSFCINAIQ